MPDWAIGILSNIISGLLGAGGLATWLRLRADARQAAAARQDEYTLKLRDALDKDEAEFRKAVYDAYMAEVARSRELDSRLTTTQGQLTIITLERDDLKRKWERAQEDLNQAHAKIRHLETEIATLQQQQNRKETA